MMKQDFEDDGKVKITYIDARDLINFFLNMDLAPDGKQKKIETQAPGGWNGNSATQSTGLSQGTRHNKRKPAGNE